MRVWKYLIGAEVTLQLPAGAKVIYAGLQGVDICIWVEIDELALTFPRKFVVVGTGHPFDGGKHISTFIDGPYVWHVYEVPADA